MKPKVYINEHDTTQLTVSARVVVVVVADVAASARAPDGDEETGSGPLEQASEGDGGGEEGGQLGRPEALRVVGGRHPLPGECGNPIISGDPQGINDTSLFLQKVRLVYIFAF